MFPLRSCYSTQARFFNDVSTLYPIVWYWAAEGAPRFSGRSTFAPLSFSGGSAADGGIVGESMGSPRPWRNGSIPMAPPSGILDGSPSQFYLGQRSSDPGISRTPFGVPVGCAGEAYFTACEGIECQLSNWTLESPLGTVIANLYFTGTFWNYFPIPPGPEIGSASCSAYSSLFPGFYNMLSYAPFIDGIHSTWYVIPANTLDVLRQLTTTPDVYDGSDVWLRYAGP